MAYRDDRNEIQWGRDNQKKLYDMKAAVVGSGYLADMVLGGLAGISVGQIIAFDNSRLKRNERSYLIQNKKAGGQKIHEIANTLRQINNIAETIPIHGKFCEAIAYPLSPDVVIEASNDSESKEDCLRYCINYRIPYLSACADRQSSRVSSYTPSKRYKGMDSLCLETLLMEEYEGKQQSPVTAGVAAGLVLEEVRKEAFLYENSRTDRRISNNQDIYYDVYTPTAPVVGRNRRIPAFYKGKKVAVAGAGATGNIVATNLALMGVGRIDVIDFDRVEEHNLNRQLLLYERVGDYKCDVVAQRAQNIDEKIEVNAIRGKVGRVEDSTWLNRIYENEKQNWMRTHEEKFLSLKDFRKKYYETNKGEALKIIKSDDLGEYDLIFGCTDNKFARLWLNSAAMEKEVAYVDGGTDGTSGQVAAYVPGKTACIECQLSLESLAPPANIIGCAQRPEGSVVMSNMIIGSIMTAEGMKIMHYLGNHIDRPIFYSSTLPQRLMNRDFRSKHQRCQDVYEKK